MLVLKALALGPMHGYGIGQRIQQMAEGMLQVEEGTLYPALWRLENKGLLEAEWGLSENTRKAKYYRLTAAGKRALHTEAEKWNRMADVIAAILGTSPEEV